MKITNRTIVLAGIAVGIAALLLTALGNPANMGFCIACFERDVPNLHSAKVVQYVRPENHRSGIGCLSHVVNQQEI